MISILEKRAEKGHKTALDEQPDLPVYLEFVWRAFKELCCHRPVSGFGLSAIPLTEIMAWFDLNNVRDTVTQHYIYSIIVRLDSHLRRLADDKSKVSSEKQKSKAKRR